MKQKPLLTTEETLQTPDGPLQYTLARKNVRNLNVRVRPDGSVSASAPRRMPQREIDAFLRTKAAWIFKNRAAMLGRPPVLPCRFSKEECLALFTHLSDDVFPLFADILGGKKPEITVRDMKSRWGVCNPARSRLTFNMRLAEKPAAAQEYVVLHEYVHFLHHNHGPGFHAEMARLMPDYRLRKKLLRQTNSG